MPVRRIEDMLVNLVGDNIGIVLLCEVCDYLEFLTGEHLAAGVGGITEYQRLGVLPERRFQHVCVEAVLRRNKRNVDRLGAGKDSVRAVVLIERREYDDLIARVGNGQHSRHHRLSGAAGNDYLGVRVDVVAHEALLLCGYRVAEVLGAPGRSVLVEILLSDLRQALEYLLRRLEIREALGEIHRAVLVGYSRHAANH